MQIREIKLADLSKLQSRVYRCEFGGTHNPEALIFEFSGKYGVGSDGNRDADYMEAITSAFLSISNTNAVVFDLRKLDYEWGNRVWHVLQCEDCAIEDCEVVGEPQKVFPIAIVVSDLCRSGFSTCQGMVPPMFDDLDEALRFVEAPARAYLDSWFRWLDSCVNQ